MTNIFIVFHLLAISNKISKKTNKQIFSQSSVCYLSFKPDEALPQCEEIPSIIIHGVLFLLLHFPSSEHELPCVLLLFLVLCMKQLCI